jgi:predicted RNA binding protein YcfA (HicA-like mRNA interferase family)
MLKTASAGANAVAAGAAPAIFVYRNCVKVADVMRAIEKDGWRLDRTRGSHRQYKHPHKKGLVTVSGNRSDEVRPGTLASIRRQAQLEELR